MAPSVQFRPFGDDLRADDGPLAAADRRLRLELQRLAVTQREIDRLQARRARELSATLAASREVEAQLGSDAAKAEEFARRSVRAEIALAFRTTEFAAERMLDHAELLESLPVTRAAGESGELSWRAVETIAQQAQLLVTTLLNESSEAEHRARLADFDVAGTALGSLVAPSRLRHRLAGLRESLTSSSAIERHRVARDERHVELTDSDNGMAWLGAYLPSVEAHAVYNRLTDMARAIADDVPEHGEAEPETRTLAQRRADLFVDFLIGDYVRRGDHDDYERRVGAGIDFDRFAGIRPTVVVTVPVQTLLDSDDGVGPAREPALLDGIVPIDPATARALTANAPGVYRLLTDPHTGAHLDLGRRRYEVSTPLRLWHRLRDGGCRFPGCGRPAKGCDVDHSVDWQYCGATRPENLAHLCRGHHTLKHQTRWGPHQFPDGSVRWRSPSGIEHITRPDQPFARSG